MTAPLCCVCGEQPRFENGVLCKGCKAEIVLTEGKAGLEAIEALHKVGDTGGTTISVSIGVGSGVPALAKAIKCEGCGKSAVYRPEKKKESYFCDECGKQLCPSCAAYCSHKDWNYQNKILCKNCRAEKSLTGQPVDEVEGSLPGQETAEPKREPKPHCGRATCVGETMEPDWCRCECLKCKNAVASGFVEPMFGKMTPDPDPVPEPAPTQDEIDEEEIAKWEGGQP